MVLVMDAGRAVDFGSTVDLLKISKGAFSELVNGTGNESSTKALSKMAIQ
jgi:ABC-type multidrug transport system fused ATPase/permease subunit